MKIIILAGNQGTGKSPTMEILYNFLTHDMKNKPIQNPINDSKKDFHCVFEYKEKKVAIYSAGDTLILLFMAIFIYRDVDCLILPFSISKKGIVDLIDEIKNNKHDKMAPVYKIIPKTECDKNASEKDKDDANIHDCSIIIKAI